MGKVNEEASETAGREQRIFAEYPVPKAVAAISLCLPVYNIMTAFANLFDIGGSSVLARAMGNGHRHRAQRAFALSVRGALIVGLILIADFFRSAHLKTAEGQTTR